MAKYRVRNPRITQMNGFYKRISKYASPRVTTVQIVCGDCAGFETLPRRTFLTAEGRCAKCGGRSYELAARVCATLEVTLLFERITAQVMARRAREPEIHFDYAN